MLKYTFILLTILFASCGGAKQENVSNKYEETQNKVSEKQTKTDNALAFINAYVENSNKMSKAVGIKEWVNSNTLVTNNFKTALTKLVDDANAQDPEMGLEADPIFDAQDYPSEGFEIESFDESENYITVKGKNQANFKLTLKIAAENGKWLVDGCGGVNVPEGKRVKR